MIPSTLAAELSGALRGFLATGFGPSNQALSSVMDEFLARESNLIKGPYLSLDLPFQHAPEGGEAFPDTPLGFTPYRHQRIAFDRLIAGQSTIVATGTGSGKSECFLFPMLDHCRAQAGAPGVKAIVIYPMNALASDQARRIAGIVERTRSLRGKVTAGLYVGETGASPRARMEADHVIENRTVLRERPPDILLTNYKMLDLLLTRPADFPLWRHNAGGVLRYLVVDELHTFDGAQGTDLACLIRRLRARLQADERLICAGTSATIGGGEDRAAILEYASDVFHQRFTPDAVVGEARQGIDEFLGDAVISSYLVAQPDLASRLDPERYESTGEYLRAQHEVFFGEVPAGDPESAEWRLSLGEKLRGHASFVNLLRVLDGSRPTPVATLRERLQRSLPVSGAGEAELCLRALCALISVARQREDSGPDAQARPLLSVKLHLWVRELRRMVCSVHEPPEDSPASALGEGPPGIGSGVVAARDGKAGAVADAPGPRSHPPAPLAPRTALQDGDKGAPAHRIRYADDLGPDEDSIHLPLIQCRECHVTGWGCVKHAAEPRVGQDLRVFYNRFFSRDVDVRYLFPLAPGEAPPRNIKGMELRVCGRCGHLAGRDRGACPGCGEDRLTPVFVPDTVVSRRSGKRARRELSRDCPYCGAREALIILGARATSLLSTALAQLFASRHNDDHKVIAFSDNVQDAAHRGSFFAARTWRNNLRAALAQAIESHEGLALGELPDRVLAWWGRPDLNPAAFDEARFISEFIAPDRLWLRDFESLREQGTLPPGSTLLSLVQRRIRWETLAELTFGSAIGRTLERTQTAAVGFDREAFRRACESTARQLREHFAELTEIDEARVRGLVLGILRRMKERGALASPVFGPYLRSGGNPFAIRNLALQDFGPRSALPVFPAPVAEGHAVEAVVAWSGKSWYQTWVEKVLTPIKTLVTAQDAADILRIVMGALGAARLVSEQAAQRTRVWALDPARLHVTTRTAVMRCGRSPRTLVVPACEADLWRGVPCLDFATQDCYAEHTTGRPTWAGRHYRSADIRRIVSAEHTALVSRRERDRLQERFAARDAAPWEPNLLSATPTLELGVDIGDLSTVVMCSVPPAPVNYVQRTGRAGRRDGNALALTVATGQAHDRYYYEEPMEMLGSRIDPPGVFLNAPAVLERQLTAFGFDCWVATGVDESAVPPAIRTVLNNVERRNTRGFPYPFFDFIADNGDDLLARFFQAFEPRSGTGGGLDDDSRQYLSAFLHGVGSEESLRLRILKRLEEVVKDRQSLRNDADALTRRIRTLQRAPADEETRARIKDLTSEHRALRELRKKIDERETFGFLTDEGLLPNYAFPEQGVTLKSVIFKRRQPEGGDGEREEDDAVVYDYLRPAVAALGEFAPRNEFYAGGRRVRIRRIDTRVSPIERWRLCPSCSYCENVDAGDRHRGCPRCGDPLWGDAGQSREMLRLHLVHAATPDRKSRIMDERDDREPLFYTRQMVADFDPASVACAFAAAGTGQPFGFEYVPRATFREINFGRLDEQESPAAFAGECMPRQGFSLCRRCGGVEGDDGEIQHTRTCNARGAGSVADCLYLYRDFQSEAVRMLVPVAGSLHAQERISSFIAALELGLRRRFAGAVEHLRVMTGKFPAPASGAGIDFLMLYDTVPGGTGYLKQMMSDPDNLLDIFRMARAALAQCACNADPSKDGCYRCVYAYRRSRDMAGTSRNTAAAVLDAILERAKDLEKVAGLRSLKVNPLLESELEARFVEALGRVEVGGEAVRVREDIVGGKPGYVVTASGATWYMEAQAAVGASEGVVIPSRPDFVMRPAREAPDRSPVAVFMDGFEYHRTRTGEDSAKRLALARAGYLVWSLTWRDLEVVLGKGGDALNVLGDDEGRMARLQQVLDTRWDTAPIRSRLGEPSLVLLVRYLRRPDRVAWKRAVFTRLLGLFEPRDMQSTELEREFVGAVTKTLPCVLRDAFGELPEETARAGRGAWRNMPPEFAQIFMALPLAAVEPPDPDRLIVAVHLNDAAQSEQDGYRREWNGVLRLYNLLQFLPGGWWTTSEGARRDLYPEFADQAAETEPPESDEWSEAVTLADAGLHATMKTLASRGLPPPEVGFELTGAAGEVIAEAELAWEAERGAVLLAEQHRAPFDAAGWRTFPADAPGLTETISAWWTETRA